MLATDERDRLIEVIRGFVGELETAVSHLTPTQLTTPYLEGEWTVAQIVHHTADSHMNSIIRLKLILTEDNPPLKPYDEAAWADLPDGNHPRLEESLSILRGLHKRWTDLLATLTPEQRVRNGRHPEVGDITPDDLVRTYANHCQTHLAQIQRVLAAGGLT